MGEQLIGRSALCELAGAKDRDPIGHLHRFIDVVTDEQNGLAQALLHAQKFVLDDLAIDGIERRKRLVHQQHRRIHGERTGDPDALRLSPGKLVRKAVEELRRLQRQKRQQLLRAPPGLCRIPAEQARNDADVFGHRHVGEQADLLDDVADAAAQLHRIDPVGIAPGNEYLARGRKDQPIDHAQGSGLAATGRTQQHARLAVRNFERHVIDGGDRSARRRIAAAQALKTNHGPYVTRFGPRGPWVSVAAAAGVARSPRR